MTENLVAEMRAIQHEESVIPNCLVVEDDPNDAELSIRALGLMGASVRLARSADEAISMLDASGSASHPDFDIVFLDLNLHGSQESGHRVLKYVRHKFPKLHVVVVSGYVDQQTVKLISSDKGGYVGMIQKPLEPMNVKEIFQKHNLFKSSNCPPNA